MVDLIDFLKSLTNTNLFVGSCGVISFELARICLMCLEPDSLKRGASVASRRFFRSESHLINFSTNVLFLYLPRSQISGCEIPPSLSSQSWIWNVSGRSSLSQSTPSLSRCRYPGWYWHCQPGLFLSDKNCEILPLF